MGKNKTEDKSYGRKHLSREYNINMRINRHNDENYRSIENVFSILFLFIYFCNRKCHSRMCEFSSESESE